jgi:hypothetical protein
MKRMDLAFCWPQKSAQEYESKGLLRVGQHRTDLPGARQEANKSVAADFPSSSILP